MKTYLVSNSTHTTHAVGATGDEAQDLPHGEHVVLDLDDDAATRHRNAGLSVTEREVAEEVEAPAAEAPAPVAPKRIRKRSSRKAAAKS